MFCSTECRDKIYELHGDDLKGIIIDYEEMALNSDQFIREVQSAFGGHEQLLKFLKENDVNKLKKTIFDFDWSEDAEKAKMMCCLSVDTSGVSAKMVSDCFQVTRPSSKHKRGHPEFTKCCLKIFKVYERYPLQMTHKILRLIYSVGFGILLFLFSMRYSCMPNMNLENIENKFYGYVLQPIKAGEEVVGGRRYEIFPLY
jgi:hypothetical protein